MRHKRIVRTAIPIVAIVAVLFVAHVLNLGQEVVKAVIALHGGQ